MTDVPTPRVRARVVADWTSLSVRKAQELAAGRIPSVAKLGGVWTFNPEKVHGWIAHQEQQARRGSLATSTSAATSGGDMSRSPATAIDAAFERLICGRRRSGSRTRVSRSSAPRYGSRRRRRSARRSTLGRPALPLECRPARRRVRPDACRPDHDPDHRRLGLRLQGQGKQPTIRRNLTTLSSLLSACVAWGRRPDNPTLAYNRKLVHERRGPINLPTSEELEHVLAHALPGTAVILRLLEQTRMRKAEAVTLERHEVDWQLRQITLTRTKTDQPRTLHGAHWAAMRGRCSMG